MRGKNVKRCFQYLTMVAAIGTAVFCFLAGICCLRLEEYRQQGSAREPALEERARSRAGEILEIYLSQGMGQADAYAKTENVNYIILKASGRRIGGNYKSADIQMIPKLGRKTLQYTYQFPGDAQEDEAGYIVKIAYLDLGQILEVPIHLEGLPDDLRIWMKVFFVTAGTALAVAAALLRRIIRIGRRGLQNSSIRKTGKMPIGKLLPWWVAAALVCLWGFRRPQVWNIPITWEEGAEPLMAQLGRSVRNMT